MNVYKVLKDNIETIYLGKPMELSLKLKGNILIFSQKLEMKWSLWHRGQLHYQAKIYFSTNR